VMEENSIGHLLARLDLFGHYAGGET
jgi:hypothetical protein